MTVKDAPIVGVRRIDLWQSLKERDGEGKKRPIYAVAVAGRNPFAGPVRAVFKYATPAWKRICGG